MAQYTTGARMTEKVTSQIVAVYIEPIVSSRLLTVTVHVFFEKVIHHFQEDTSSSLVELFLQDFLIRKACHPDRIYSR